ncbi:unnamed protein product [Cyprideis torosa]|uniref:Uncharacterized protein n=1 Tax=Cyprideis torosa TaxID=163714 RepID=A0A7R8W2H1_9CRUS|nr:unnamed protein product [Cyprideis torosa]CAG0881955.1 unnamed protein product [Cyprideis torosa]
MAQSTRVTMEEDQVPFISEKNHQESIVDDFMYGNNVASAHIYIRMGFLRKVYGLLSCQLLCTVVVAGIMVGSEVVRTAVQESPIFLGIAMFSSIGLIFALMLKAHEHPLNMYLLAAFVSQKTL